MLTQCQLHFAADSDWDKDWSSPTEKKASPGMPRPSSRSGSASSLRGKAAAGTAKDASGPNGGSWAGWDDDHSAAPTSNAAATGSKKEDTDDWGKW